MFSKHCRILVSLCIVGILSASNILKRPPSVIPPVLVLKNIVDLLLAGSETSTWTDQPTPCWNEMGCISILESLFPQEVCPDTQSVYNFILVSSLHIISAIIPNYTGFKTVVAAEIECVSRLLSCSVVLKMTGSDILLHLCCLGLMWCWITAVVPKVVSRGPLGSPGGHEA